MWNTCPPVIRTAHVWRHYTQGCDSHPTSLGSSPPEFCVMPGLYYTPHFLPSHLTLFIESGRKVWLCLTLTCSGGVILSLCREVFPREHLSTERIVQHTVEWEVPRDWLLHRSEMTPPPPLLTACLLHYPRGPKGCQPSAGARKKSA